MAAIILEVSAAIVAESIFPVFRVEGLAAAAVTTTTTILSFVGPVRRSVYLSLSSLTVFFNRGGREP